MKTQILTLLALLFFFTETAYAQWSEVGTPIIGETDLSFFGESVTISGDGNFMAAGQPSRGTNANQNIPGPVIIYERNGNDWTEIERIPSPINFDEFFGEDIKFNFDGSRLVFGAPILEFGVVNNIGRAFVYERQANNSYTQLGLDIMNPGQGSFFGGSVSISEDGMIIAVGTPFIVPNAIDEGFVHTFQYNGTAWVQIGQALGGDPINDLRFGHSVSLSGDGTTLVVGITTGTNAGLNGAVDIYDFNATNNMWELVGNRFIGDGERLLGSDVDITPDGNTTIFGADRNGAAGLTTYVEVYERSGGSFVQKGSRIDSQLGFRGFGVSVSISDDAEVISFGANVQTDPITQLFQQGSVKMYAFENNDWSFTDEFFGTSFFENLGGHSDMSGDGLCVVAGGASHDPADVGDGFGIVRTYNFVDQTPACVANSVLNVNTVTAPIYLAETINSDATISQGQSVDYYYSESVNLTLDFEVVLGAEFETIIAACN